MLAPTFALMIRAFRQDSRSVRGHAARFVLVLLIWMCMSWAQSMSTIFGAPGLQFFTSICYLNFVFISVAGISFFATPITEEKEEDTIGLLKMAGMTRGALLFGKSTTRLLGGMILLLVQLPFTLLAITLGGVTLAQVLAAYIALLAYMIFIANLGLLCSVVCKRSGTASALTAIMLALFCVVPNIGSLLIIPGLQNMQSISSSGDLSKSLTTFFDNWHAIIIYNRIDTILTTGFAESPLSLQVGVSLVVATCCFGLAWLLFDVCTRNVGTAEADPVWCLRRFRSPFGTRESTRVWKEALAWKDFYFIAGGHRMMILKFFGYLIILGVTSLVSWKSTGQRPWDDIEEQGQLIMAVALTLMVIECAALAARVFHTEHFQKTLPSLVLLPMTITKIAYWKITGCLLSLGPSAVFLCLGALCAPDIALDAVAAPVFWYMLILFGLFLHLTALFSLTMKWGALPLAFLVTFFLNTCCPFFGFSLFMMGDGEGQVGASIAIALLGVVTLLPFQLAIFARIDNLASR